MLENKTEYDRMAKVERVHWWYCSLHERILNVIQKNFSKRNDIEILDAGCGTGGLLLYFQKKGFKNLRGFDISEFAVSACKNNDLPVFRASLTEIAIHVSPQSMDVIVCCDALYFLPFEEQKKTLADFYRLLRPGGVIIINLPSLEVFSGTHDMSVGIKKRFHHKMLRDLLPQDMAGGYCYRYWPVLLSPIIAIFRAFQRIRIKSGKYNIKSDIDLPGFMVNKLLKAIMKLEMKFLPAINFGSSLFVVAKKKCEN